MYEQPIIIDQNRSIRVEFYYSYHTKRTVINRLYKFIYTHDVLSWKLFREALKGFLNPPTPSIKRFGTRQYVGNYGV